MQPVRGTYRCISKEELDRLLDRPYNPPEICDDREKKVFHDEYWATHHRCMDALMTLGTHDAFGDGDFCMNEDWYLSRGISVTLTSRKLWRMELIPLIQMVLCA